MYDIIPDGVWPTMITPYTADNKIDYDGLGSLMDWYIANGVHGIFAVCQSSEMYSLSLEERVNIAKFVKEYSKDRIPVIASGHISDNKKDQIEELKAMADTGIDALVIVSNHLADREEDDEIWKQRAEQIMKAVPDIPLGIYECPVPYKRTVSPELLKWCAQTGRFYFLKDTCCDLKQIFLKYEAVKETKLKIYNANSSTLLDSLKIGVSGFSGVMANFHPDLYVWLVEHWTKEKEKAQAVQDFLGIASLAERQNYPLNAKYYLKLNSLPIYPFSRVCSNESFGEADQLTMEQLMKITEKIRRALL